MDSFGNLLRPPGDFGAELQDIVANVSAFNTAVNNFPKAMNNIFTDDFVKNIVNTNPGTEDGSNAGMEDGTNAGTEEGTEDDENLGTEAE